MRKYAESISTLGCSKHHTAQEQSTEFVQVLQTSHVSSVQVPNGLILPSKVLIKSGGRTTTKRTPTQISKIISIREPTTLKNGTQYTGTRIFLIVMVLLCTQSPYKAQPVPAT